MGYLYNMKVTISESQFIRMVNNSKGWGLIGINEMLTPIKIKNKSDELELKYLGTIDGELVPRYKVVDKLVIKNKDGKYNKDYTWLYYNNKELLKKIKPDTVRHLTPDKVRNIAKKYDTRKEFEKGDKGAYAAAIKFGPCYDKTTGEEVVCKYHNKEKNFMVYTPNSINSFGFLDSICSHMKSGGSYGSKMVYSYTFFDNTNKVVGVYVGITNDEERRKGEHLTGKSTFTNKEVKSAVSNFIKENPTFKVKYKLLTDIIPFKDAQIKEKEYVNNAKSNGYKVLNISRTGGGGRTFKLDDYYIDKAQDWVKMKLENGEIPYIGDYDEFDPANYRAVRTKKLMDIAFKGMEYKDQKKYSDEDIIKAAMSSDSYTDFYKKYKNTVNQQARRRGLLPQIHQMFADGLNTPDQTTPETTPSV